MAHRALKQSNILVLMIVASLWACDNRQQTQEEVQIPDVVIDAESPDISYDTLGNVLYQRVVFSGFRQEVYPEGAPLLVEPFYLGKLHGDLIRFYPNGDTMMIRPYVKGQKHGEHFAWYPNGQMKFRYYFENGLSEGNHKVWFEDGGLSMNMNYKDGKEFGPQQMYRSDGKFRSNYVVRENGRKYGLVGLKRCAKLDGETGDFDPYRGM
ncbi:MAG: toxin-antitoxin system YwqK family antitoxin [Cyclobacteriaceae bacterium]